MCVSVDIASCAMYVCEYGHHFIRCVSGVVITSVVLSVSVVITSAALSVCECGDHFISAGRELYMSACGHHFVVAVRDLCVCVVITS